MINRSKFEKARAAVRLARVNRDLALTALVLKYGRYISGWCTRAERAVVNRRTAAYERAAKRIWKLLEDSPRDWRMGVPCSWVVEDLPYCDAIALLSEPLSAQPPCAYGYTESVK